VASIDAQTSMTATHRERKEASEDGGDPGRGRDRRHHRRGRSGQRDRVQERGRDLQLSGHGNLDGTMVLDNASARSCGGIVNSFWVPSRS
jgi:hypothetical protein